MKKKGDGTYEYEIDLLHRKLLEEDRISNEDMSRLVGFDVSSKGPRPYVLRTARARADKEDGRLFLAVRGWGVKLASDLERIQVAESKRHSARKNCKKGISALEGISDLASLGDDKKTDLNSVFTHLDAIQKVCSPQAARMVRKWVTDAQARLPSSNVLRLFGGSK